MFFVLFGIYLALVFLGSSKRKSHAIKRLKNTLVADEQLISYSIQLRVFAILLKRRNLIGITNNRVIFLRRGLLGGFNMLDMQWKDLRDVTISENILPNIFGSNLKFDFSYSDKKTGIKNGIAVINGIKSNDAMNIYTYSQREEQAWQEKRRIRGIEEKRAAAGGVFINPSALGNNLDTSQNSVIDEIHKAKSLLDSGLISDVEFNEIKSKILQRSF